MQKKLWIKEIALGILAVGIVGVSTSLMISGTSAFAQTASDGDYEYYVCGPQGAMCRHLIIHAPPTPRAPCGGPQMPSC